jgi:hypothetical protein
VKTDFRSPLKATSANDYGVPMQKPEELMTDKKMTLEENEEENDERTGQ